MAYRPSNGTINVTVLVVAVWLFQCQYWKTLVSLIASHILVLFIPRPECFQTTFPVYLLGFGSVSTVAVDARRRVRGCIAQAFKPLSRNETNLFSVSTQFIKNADERCHCRKLPTDPSLGSFSGMPGELLPALQCANTSDCRDGLSIPMVTRVLQQNSAAVKWPCPQEILDYYPHTRPKRGTCNSTSYCKNTTSLSMFDRSDTICTYDHPSITHNTSNRALPSDRMEVVDDFPSHRNYSTLPQHKTVKSRPATSAHEGRQKLLELCPSLRRGFRPVSWMLQSNLMQTFALWFQGVGRPLALFSHRYEVPVKDGDTLVIFHSPGLIAPESQHSRSAKKNDLLGGCIENAVTSTLSPKHFVNPVGMTDAKLTNEPPENYSPRHAAKQKVSLPTRVSDGCSGNCKAIAVIFGGAGGIERDPHIQSVLHSLAPLGWCVYFVAVRGVVCPIRVAPPNLASSMDVSAALSFIVRQHLKKHDCETLRTSADRSFRQLVTAPPKHMPFETGDTMGPHCVSCHTSCASSTGFDRFFQAPQRNLHTAEGPTILNRGTRRSRSVPVSTFREVCPCHVQSPQCRSCDGLPSVAGMVGNNSVGYPSVFSPMAAIPPEAIERSVSNVNDVPPIYLIGFSLGACCLVNFLGQAGKAARQHEKESSPMADTIDTLHLASAVPPFVASQATQLRCTPDDKLEERPIVRCATSLAVASPANSSCLSLPHSDFEYPDPAQLAVASRTEEDTSVYAEYLTPQTPGALRPAHSAAFPARNRCRACQLADEDTEISDIELMSYIRGAATTTNALSPGW
eukprot:GHVT01002256.1.p1 GENE.GHVT01002256.1~~GHVT01002256.1.p1  ORF type:complete len:796 (+),score=42.22 GHVT01002256.1:2705-5092(+)